MHKINDSGVSVVLALFVLSAVLAIALSLSNILLSELRLGRSVGNSVPAFFAADSGIEKILTVRDDPITFSECTDPPPAVTCELSSGARFWVEVTPAGSDCTADNYCIKSIGEFRDTRRAIEVNY